MVGVKNIKIQMYGGLIGAAVVFMAASLLFDTAKKYTRSGYYYWSRDVRDVVSIMNGIGVFLLLIGVGLLGAGIVAMILKKSGKFCPDCEKVFFRTAVMCPRCKTDLRYAKSVKMYLSERPRIMQKELSKLIIGSKLAGLIAELTDFVHIVERSWLLK